MVDVIFTIFDATKLDEPNVEQLRFTNIDMEVVKRVIDILNEDVVDQRKYISTPETCSMKELHNIKNGLYCGECGWRATSVQDVPIRPSIGEFTQEELFPHGAGEWAECTECGGAVTDCVKHTDWHNKLLP